MQLIAWNHGLYWTITTTHVPNVNISNYILKIKNNSNQYKHNYNNKRSFFKEIMTALLPVDWDKFY